MDGLLLPTHGSGLRKLLLAHAMGGGGAVEKTVTGPLVTVTDALAKPAKSLVVNFAPVQAAGTPAPDNVLPITGWTGVTGYRTGVNVWDGLYSATNKYLSTNGELNSGNNEDATSYIPVKGGQSYYIAPTYGNYSSLCWYDISQAYISGSSYGGASSKTVTAPANACYLRATVYKSNASNFKVYLSDDSEKDYASYTGTTYPVDWTDEAGTVYGGYVDLVSGELVTTMALKDMSTVGWNEDSNRPGVFFGNFGTERENTSNIVACSVFDVWNNAVSTSLDNYISGVASYGGNTPFFRCSAWAGYTRAQVQEALTGQFVAFILATPVTYQLDPQTVTMLKGTNNVWSNANGNISLTYISNH